MTSFGMMTWIEFLLRWSHIFFGVMWIGHLYYFNYTQGAFLGATDVDNAAKTVVRARLLPIAMFYFRWGAMWTFVTGFMYWALKGHMFGSFSGYLSSGYGVAITSGAILGITMWANVWFVIWPKQKIVIANATKLAKGEPALPEAAAAGASANIASRTNTLLSIPLLFFMASASHLTPAVSDSSNLGVYWLVFLLIWAAIEFNALKGKTGKMMTTVRQVTVSGIILTAVYVGLMAVTL